MNNTEKYSFQEPTVPGSKWSLAYSLGQVVGKMTAVIWRWGNDRQVVASFVGRYSAHLAVLALALLVGLLGRLALAPFDVTEIGIAESSDFGSPSQQAAAESVATPTVTTVYTSVQRQLANQSPRAVFRQALPRTDIPDRVRLGVITYTVQSGDNIFWIADYFGLSAYTIAWANMETLQGAPYLIQPGLTLFIPPVDGVYHTVLAGETPDSIAEQFDVASADLYNMWNGLEEEMPLVEGMQLVIPGGVGDDVEWEAPPPEPVAPGVGTASASWGYCGDTAVSGPGATGWFILPTGSSLVSGWYFHDVRNPGHIGLDYKCSLGDPIYAVDNGVVIFAGWSGGYGNLVRVSHGNGYQTYYAHFNGFAVGCGEPVYQGQVLGYCGTTGWSTGPHLHYEIRLNGVPLDPQLFE